ncbi:HNH endonuclease [Paenibacillus qinlingensis]|uniref:HNH nuclease domain-containing protein n=1 Tax=Paenibacillus qinlingensis TaxID=1837343 RepID=A0ABU1P6N9_9BACL|nr:HNH endonuclease [Paenibacillus qinlingensis]MDR6555425.1 hypothetical protein [Paenibacillus qinlingensis]
MKHKYEIKGDISIIYLESKDVTHEVLIDTEDLEKVKIYRWNINSKGKNNRTLYVSAYKKENRKNVFITNLHRYIMGLEKGNKLVVDHINHNGLDNRKENLRIVTVAENAQNLISGKRGSRTGVRGLSWSKSLKMWQVRIHINKKLHHFGYFHDYDEAQKLAETAYSKLMPYSKNSNPDVVEENFLNEIIKLKRKTPKRNNKSGVRGVSFVTAKKMWKAELQINKKRFQFGLFERLEDAKKVIDAINNGEDPHNFIKLN